MRNILVKLRQRKVESNWQVVQSRLMFKAATSGGSGCSKDWKHRMAAN